MNLSRVSKKVPHEDSRMTMLAFHENKIKEFENYYKTRPEKEVLLEQLKIKFKAMRNVYSNEAFELKKKIEKLDLVIQDMYSQSDYSEYLMKSAQYLKEYKNSKNISLDDPYENGIILNKTDKINISNIEDSDEEDFDEEEEHINKNDKNETFEYISARSNKGQISKIFMQDCLGEGLSLGLSLGLKKNETALYCQDCKMDKVINHKEALATCLGCGLTETYQDSELTTEFSEEIEVLSPFSYKRINHFKEWISMMLARESASPPEDVIDKLLLELKKDCIRKTEDVTPKRIRNYLKRLGLNKQYEHVPAIIYKICGVTPPVISRELENKLINMFEEIQLPFEKHKPRVRKNFLSYSYVLHKFVELLGQDYLLDSFPLLKSREKLYEQDRLFALICNDLGWTFIPSI